jgi:mono/diheme cytochrome c family protein
MTRIGRWLAIGFGALVVLIVVAAVAIYVITNVRLNRRYAVTPLPLAPSADAATVERGRHLVQAVVKCGDCHGENLGGQVFLDVPPFRLVAPNLTRGQGGVAAQYADADWLRSIRHGVRRDGRALLVMPARELMALEANDLAAVIAYVLSVPPVDNVLPATQLRLLGRVLLFVGALPPPDASVIDHSAPFPAPVPRTVSVEYGRYLATVGGCVGCHGPGLSGGRVPGVPPDFPPASNLTPSGPIGQWTEADFFRALREGKRPTGAPINPFMPWQASGKMTDDEIRAVWQFLKSVPPRESGTR